MNRILYKLLILLAFLNCRQLIADTYPEVVFDNSIVNGTYAKSTVNYSEKSWVENINKHLLVSDTIFFTPGNALSLKYLSSEKGYWETTINYNRLKYSYVPEQDEVLSLWLYVNSNSTKISDLPNIFILQALQRSSDTLNIEPYITNFQSNKWIQIKIPVKNFKIKNKNIQITGIGLSQPKKSKGYHHIYLDQIEFLPNRYSEIPLRSPAMLSDAKSYDKTVHLKWQLPLTPSIRFIKIYRSTDGKNFNPVSIRPIHMQSCFDIVPQMGQKYYYKITWMDYNYKESPFSSVKEVEAKPLGDSSIIKLVQLAHVNYFVENFDVNTGMHLPYRSKHKVIVSTRETAGAILSLLVGVHNEFVSRQTALNRISKIVFFLLRSQNKHGILPAYYDGRRGLPEYIQEDAIYDVQATAEIVEALLVAREFFNSDNDNEKDLRNRITQLYNRINWQECLTPDSRYLQKKLSMLENPDLANQGLVGFDDAINTYLLAMGSPKNSISQDLLYNAIYDPLTPQIEHPELQQAPITDSLTQDTNEQTLAFLDSITAEQSDIDTTIFGLKLPFGIYNKSVMNIYRPFLTVKPERLHDTLTNWKQTLTNYVLYTKRRDNEVGVGAANSDIWGFYQHRDTLNRSFRINPAIASSAIMVDEYLGNRSILTLYRQYGHILFTEYGFRAWLDLRNNDASDEYMSFNQAAVAIAIENAQSGLIWNLYDKIPELQKARETINTK